MVQEFFSTIVTQLSDMFICSHDTIMNIFYHISPNIMCHSIFNFQEIPTQHVLNFVYNYNATPNFSDDELEKNYLMFG